MVEVTIIEILRTLALTGFQASEKNLSAQLSDRAKFHVISCHFRPAKTRKADSGFTEISHFLVEMLVYSCLSPYFSRLSAVLQEKSHVFSHCFRGVHIGLNLHQIPLNTRPDYQLHPTPSCRTHQYTYLMWYGCLYVLASL